MALNWCFRLNTTQCRGNVSSGAFQTKTRPSSVLQQKLINAASDRTGAEAAYARSGRIGNGKSAFCWSSSGSSQRAARKRARSSVRAERRTAERSLLCYSESIQFDASKRGFIRTKRITASLSMARTTAVLYSVLDDPLITERYIVVGVVVGYTF